MTEVKTEEFTGEVYKSDIQIKLLSYNPVLNSTHYCPE